MMFLAGMSNFGLQKVYNVSVDDTIRWSLGKKVSKSGAGKLRRYINNYLGSYIPVNELEYE